MSNEVNKPEHYRTGDIECIAAIEAAMTPEEFAGYLRGNVMKYLWRYDKKHKTLQDRHKDLQKAQWYLHRLNSFRLRVWHLPEKEESDGS
jgi:hypothetical protein